jgi:predicted transcriptional regulator
MLPKRIPVTDLEGRTGDRLLERRIELLEGILQGRQDLAEGRTVSHEEVMARTARWA